MTDKIETTEEAQQDIEPKLSKTRISAAVGTSAMALALIAGACGSGSEGSASSGNEASEGSEGGSEGSGSGEASEGGTGQGEAAEAGHGGEGGQGEVSEGGVVNLLTPAETYDETVNGARLLLSFDSAANAFVGTVANTTTGPLTRARVEVHLSNGTELGPTTPTDLAAGEIINLSLPSTTAAFDTWSAHPEVGQAEAGGGQAAGSTTHLTSTGVSRGVYSTQQLTVDDSYAGKLNGLELAVTFDAANDQFVARVKNEANEGLCNTSIDVVLDGNRAAPQSVLIPSLDLRGRADFTIDAGSTSFDTWAVEADTFTCSTIVSDGGEGSESGGGESGAEGGEEASPSTPIDQAATGNFNNLDYEVAYDPATKAFRGSVTNNTSQVVCSSRLEIHMAANGNVIELGPTIGVDLVPGETLDVVLSADPVTPDTYSLHPESSPCNGQVAATGEGSEGGAGEGSEGAGHETSGG